MKIKFSLQLKLLVAVTLVIIIALSISAYLTADNQRKLLQLSFRDLGIALAQAMDAGIGSRAELNDIQKLQSNIYKTIWLNADITKISISLPVEDGLKIVASNDTTILGQAATPESIDSYQKGIIKTKVLTENNGSRVLNVITPVHIGGQRAGAYEIRLSLATLEEEILRSQIQFLVLMTITTIVIIIVLFLLIKTAVINPINWLQKGAQIIGSGNLDYRIKIKKRDEIGELAVGFNEMAQNLKESHAGLEKKIQEKTKELAEAKDVLEIKIKARTKELRELADNLDEQVKQRTKELQERINELERFHKLIVGREMKMVELKEQVQALKHWPLSGNRKTKKQKRAD